MLFGRSYSKAQGTADFVNKPGRISFGKPKRLGEMADQLNILKRGVCSPIPPSHQGGLINLNSMTLKLETDMPQRITVQLNGFGKDFGKRFG